MTIDRENPVKSITSRLETSLQCNVINFDMIESGYVDPSINQEFNLFVFSEVEFRDISNISNSVLLDFNEIMITKFLDLKTIVGINYIKNNFSSLSLKFYKKIR
jgi:hypothetical protein